MFCKKCGTQMIDGSVFCMSCGTKVEEEKAKPAVIPVMAPATPLGMNGANTAPTTPAAEVAQTAVQGQVNNFPGTPNVEASLPEAPAPQVAAQPAAPAPMAMPTTQAPTTPATPTAPVPTHPERGTVQPAPQTPTQPVAPAPQTPAQPAPTQPYNGTRPTPMNNGAQNFNQAPMQPGYQAQPQNYNPTQPYNQPQAQNYMGQNYNANPQYNPAPNFNGRPNGSFVPTQPYNPANNYGAPQPGYQAPYYPPNGAPMLNGGVAPRPVMPAVAPAPVPAPMPMPVPAPVRPVVAPQIVVPRKRHGFGGLIAVFILLFVLASAFEVYIKFFVAGPDDCALSFMNAISDFNLQEMAKYMEDDDAAVIEAELQMVGMAGDMFVGLAGGLLGVDLGFIDASGMLDNLGGYAAIAKQMGVEVPEFKNLKVVSVRYTNGEEDEIIKKNPFDFLELKKILAKEAYVEVTGSYNGGAFHETIKMVRVGFGDWRVAHETIGSADFLGLEQLYKEMQAY